MTARRYQAQATQIAAKYGFSLIRSRKHLIWSNGKGATVVSPQCSTCRRSLKNFESNCRRLAA